MKYLVNGKCFNLMYICIVRRMNRIVQVVILWKNISFGSATMFDVVGNLKFESDLS